MIVSSFLTLFPAIASARIIHFVCKNQTRARKSKKKGDRKKLKLKPRKIKKKQKIAKKMKGLKKTKKQSTIRRNHRGYKKEKESKRTTKK